MRRLYNLAGKVDWERTEEQVHKYIPLDKALAIFDEEAVIVIGTMLPYLHGNYSNILVDYKVRLLRKGACGCPLPGFHYDCVKDFNHPARHEHHILYTNVDGTLFKGDNGETIKAFDGDVWEYGRELHSAPFVSSDCKRVLIRLTETDSVKVR